MDFDLDAHRPHIINILHAHHDALPLHAPIDTVTITPLGIGENNLMLHILLNKQVQLTIRIAYQPDTPVQNLSIEFRDLQQLPAGFGPRPFYLDTSRQELPYPFAILSFVPGTTPAHWSEEILRIHAAKLARLHQHETTFWTDREGRQYNVPFDLYQRFARNLVSWQTRYPQFFEETSINQLVPHLDSYFREYNPLFTSLTRFSLIHADLCASNILFHESDVHYIDWEYMGYGDSAIDIAQLAWDIDNPPWQIKLTGQALDTFLQTYLASHPDPTLAERHKVWSTYLKFFDHFGYRLKAQQAANAIQAFPSAYYQATIQRMVDSLVQQFL